jgi:uncharacterized tellurite resistance protein B-like protein
MVIKKIHEKNLCNILSDAVCCMMCVDGKIFESEKKAIHTVLTKAGVPWDKKETKARIEAFLQKIKEQSLKHVIQETSENIPLLKETGKEDTLLTSLKYVMYSDGRISDKEVRLLEQFTERLKQEPTSKAIDDFKKDRIEEKKSSRSQDSKQKPLSTAQEAAKALNQKEPCPYCGIRISFPVAECMHCKSKIKGSKKEHRRQGQLKELLLQKEWLNNCSDSTYEKEYPKWLKAYVSWRKRGWSLIERFFHHWTYDLVIILVIFGYFPACFWLLFLAEGKHPILKAVLIFIAFCGFAFARKLIYSWFR